VITAAHCICEVSGTGAACPDGTFFLDLNDYLVFFPNGGEFPVSSASVAPGYGFGIEGDIAVLELAYPIRSVAPVPINLVGSPAFGTSGVAVGFGTQSDSSADSGIKRQAAVATSTCSGSGISDAEHVCWDSGAPAICLGDSGGPLFADVGAGSAVVGVLSGGAPMICTPGDVTFSTDVFVQSGWITAEAGADLDATACGDGPQVGDVGVTVDGFGGVVSSSETESFEVPAGVKQLRVALNAELGDPPNDFDLRVRFGSPPNPGNSDCAPLLLGSFEYCEFQDPSPGTWYAEVKVFSGGPGEYQIVATQILENPAPPAPGLGDLFVADFLSWEVFQVDRATGDRAIVSSSLRGSGSDLAAPEGLRLDANDDLVVANFEDRSVLEIDTASGDRSVVSGCVDLTCSGTVGSGPDLLGPRFLAFEDDGDVILTDREGPGVNAVVRIDPATGNRTTVSGCTSSACTTVIGAGPAMDALFGVVVEASGDIVVADSFALLRIDPLTGDRVVLSGCTDVGCSGTVGAGIAFEKPQEIELDASGNVLVADGDPTSPPFRAVLRVDSVSGDRSVVSGCADAACNAIVGAGTLFSEGLIGLQVENTGAILVSDNQQRALFQVDPNNGGRTVVSGCVDAACSSLVGSGTEFTNPLGLTAIPLPEPGSGLGVAAGIVLVSMLRRRREARAARAGTGLV
jgi:hypothetical protein